MMYAPGAIPENVSGEGRRTGRVVVGAFDPGHDPGDVRRVERARPPRRGAVVSPGYGVHVRRR